MSDIQIMRILVPIDGSDSSIRAAKYAVKIANMANADIIFMHAVVNPPYVEYETAGVVVPAHTEEARRHAEMWFMAVGDLASKQNVKFSTDTILNVNSAADSIVSYADNNKVDLIIIGTKGRTGIKRFIVGSVANSVVSHAKCPVMVVR